MNNFRNIILFVIVLVLAIGLFFVKNSATISSKKTNNIVNAVPSGEVLSKENITLNQNNNNSLEQDTSHGGFYEKVLSQDNAMDELVAIVGQNNIDRISALNRIDKQIVKKGKTIVVPVDSTDEVVDYFMPQKLNSLVDVQKAVIIYQRTQAFGFYENGLLVRSGPVSSGRKNSPTPPGLYFTNWKGKRVISTVDDSWILKWNFNIDNENGIGIHQYVLPGYPDSHSCVRVTESDAVWLYNWADQWILDETGHNKLANGTPVIVYGEYDFETIAPWKDLVNNSKATFIDESELDAGISIYKDRILQEQMYRENVILNKNTTNEIQNQ